MSDSHDEPLTERLLIEIEAWDFALFVGLSRDSVPAEVRFQGGLSHSHSLVLDGRMPAPGKYAGERVQLWLSGFAPDVLFGPGEFEDVGDLHDGRSEGRGFSGHLRIPDADMPIAATALASVWKYIHVWVTDTGEDDERVTMFSFDRDLHPNIAAWAESTQVEGA